MTETSHGGLARVWHRVPAGEVITALQTDAAGLTDQEAAARLAAHGPNRLPARRRRNPVARLFRHFHNILIYVLLGAAVVTAALGHLADTAVILAVVVANAVIGFIQEGKAERAMDAIRGMLAPRASVIRGGVRRTIDGEELVPGDVVVVEAGDRVPADLRLIEARGVRVQEAILTGESVPVEKRIEAVEADVVLGDRACMAYSGTMVTTGQGRGVVVATGTGTEIGRISGLLSGVEELTTPLVRQMGVFAKWLTMLILSFAAVLLAFGFFVEHYSFVDVFMVVVGLSVAAIPEGLPAVLTITLAVGVQAMARRNAIIRRLPAIETIGSVSVICSDKTGTLTRNEMVVASAVTRSGEFRIDGVGYEPFGAMHHTGDTTVDRRDDAATAELARGSAMCNDASLRHHEGMWRVEGDPMEGALLAFAGKAGVDAEALSAWTRTDAIPFDAQHRFMATLHHDHNGHGVVYVKGAPERILTMCASHRAADGGTDPIDVGWWCDRAEAVASQGRRVLAIATRAMPADHTVVGHEDVASGLTMVGLVGLIDPPRTEAIDAVAECHAAGICVKMITGDHAGTAAAIGRQIGLRSTDRVITGADIESMDDAALEKAALATDVFARTSPEHKLRLVMALQAGGLTVAMTGDGVNDAPALKRADAGIAMGCKGSEAAKEASELVLADDNFASIVAAVREGRTVYDNIKKVISWTLPTNAGEAMTIVVALVLGMTMPITAIQILWVNLITGITLGLALAFEPTEPNTMRRPPRRRDEPILTGGLVWHIVVVSTLIVLGVFGMFASAIDRGHSIELSRTIALNTLVAMEIFHLFFIRNIYSTSVTWRLIRGTPVVWATVASVTAAQFAITYFPPLQRVFGTEAVPVIDGIAILGVGIALFTIIELEKQVRLRMREFQAA